MTFKEVQEILSEADIYSINKKNQTAHTRPLTESIAALSHPWVPGYKRLPVNGWASQMQNVRRKVVPLPRIHARIILVGNKNSLW